MSEFFVVFLKNSCQYYYTPPLFLITFAVIYYYTSQIIKFSTFLILTSPVINAQLWLTFADDHAFCRFTINNSSFLLCLFYNLICDFFRKCERKQEILKIIFRISANRIAFFLITLENLSKFRKNIYIKKTDPIKKSYRKTNKNSTKLQKVENVKNIG